MYHLLFCNCCVTSCSQVKSTLLLSDIIRPFNSYHQAVEGLYVKKIYCHSIISKDACTPFISDRDKTIFICL